MSAFASRQSVDRIVRAVGGRLRHPLNAVIARFSLLPNTPMLDPALFPWARPLTDNWTRIRDEVARAMPATLPNIADLAPDHLGINPDRLWK